MRDARPWFLALFAGAFVAVTVAACLPGRLPTCKTDDECKSHGKAKICLNMRCVECHYDDNCASGQVCSPTGQCQGISEGKPTPEPETSPDGGPSGAPTVE